MKALIAPVMPISMIARKFSIGGYLVQVFNPQ
jgi:hypothetical protein